MNVVTYDGLFQFCIVLLTFASVIIMFTKKVNHPKFPNRAVY